jgi:hypothetical protein
MVPVERVILPWHMTPPSLAGLKKLRATVLRETLAPTHT